jgi:hypothetical protein
MVINVNDVILGGGYRDCESRLKANLLHPNGSLSPSLDRYEPYSCEDAPTLLLECMVVRGTHEGYERE